MRKFFEFLFLPVWSSLRELFVFRSSSPSEPRKKKKIAEKPISFSKRASKSQAHTSSTDALNNGADAVALFGCHAQIRCRGRAGGARARSRFHRRRRRRQRSLSVVVGSGASVDSEPLSTPAAAPAKEGKDSPSPPSSSVLFFSVSFFFG